MKNKNRKIIVLTLGILSYIINILAYAILLYKILVDKGLEVQGTKIINTLSPTTLLIIFSAFVVSFTIWFAWLYLGIEYKGNYWYRLGKSHLIEQLFTFIIICIIGCLLIFGVL